MNNQVPDLFELFEHKGQKHVCHGWFKLEKTRKPGHYKPRKHKKHLPKHVIRNDKKRHAVAGRIIASMLREDNAKGFVLVPCNREEATSISGDSYYRINKIKPLGVYSQSDLECQTLDEVHAQWKELVSDDDKWLCCDLELSTLKRLYPDVDFTYPW